MFRPELKKGSMELLILSMLEQKDRHGYEIGQVIERRSGGRIEFRISTLYSALYRLEKKDLIKGRWVEKKGQRRRCYYHLTDAGQGILSSRREEWKEFASVINALTGVSHA